MTPTDAAITTVWEEIGEVVTQQEARRRLEEIEGDGEHSHDDRHR